MLAVSARCRSQARPVRVLAVAVALGAHGVLPALASDRPPSGAESWMDASATGHEIDVSAERAAGGTHRVAVSPDMNTRYQRSAWVVCSDDAALKVPLIGPGMSCADASFEAARVCPDGEHAVDPEFVSVRDAESPTGWGPWELSRAGWCAGPVDLAAEVAREFARLPLAASPVSVPPNGWVMVNMDTVVFTSPDAQVFDLVVLGTPVRVSARPVEFSWDFADGTPPLVTSDPGRAFPHQTVAHTYTRGGSYVVTLTTTWMADFQVIGSDGWSAVPGVATTTSAGVPLEVYEARAHLVDGPCPTTGPCTLT